MTETCSLNCPTMKQQSFIPSILESILRYIEFVLRVEQ